MGDPAPPPIETRRLRLMPIDPEAAEALLEGRRVEAEGRIGATLPDSFPLPGDRPFLEIQLGRMRSAPSRRGWLARVIVLRSRPVAVGHITFHGPPEMIGRAEIGYTVFPEHRRQGYAGEATAGMIAWAQAQGVASVFLSIAPGNVPSLAIARALGFRQVGVQEDALDGAELVFERELARAEPDPSREGPPADHE